MSHKLLLLILAIVAFIFSAVSAQSGDAIILNAACWLGVGSALFASAHLPI